MINFHNTKEDIIYKNPNLKDKELAFVGTKARSGDIVDGFTPIYAAIQNNSLGEKYEGSRYGGTGGYESTLLRDNCVVTGIIIWTAIYFGREEIIGIQLRWNKLNRQGIDTESIYSEKLGTGRHSLGVRLKKEYYKSNHYICSLRCKTSDHTSGETFLHDLEIDWKEASAISKSDSVSSLEDIFNELNRNIKRLDEKIDIFSSNVVQLKNLLSSKSTDILRKLGDRTPDEAFSYDLEIDRKKSTAISKTSSDSSLEEISNESNQNIERLGKKIDNLSSNVDKLASEVYLKLIHILHNRF